MGFRISWVGFQDLSKADVLQIIGGVDTGTVDEANEAPFSVAELPVGWSILFCNDFGYVSEDTLKALSAHCVLVACQVHEGVMYSAAYEYERGRERWSVTHDSSVGIRNLSVSGSPAPEFADIRARLSKAQEDKPGNGVDYFFDIPVEAAAARCAYRHDRWKFAWGRPTFTVVDIR